MDKQDLSSVIYKDFADKMNDSVKSQVTSPALNAEKVRDFLAGMTDDYFLSQAQMIGCTVPKKK
jgi:dGTP triphosphohydrolase